MSYIRKKLILLVALAVLPALAIILYSGLDQRRQAIEAARREVLLLVQNMSETQQGQLASVRQTLSVLARMPEIRNLDAAASREIFHAVTEQTPAYFNIAAAHVNGEVFASGKPFVRTNLADRKHFREALAQKDLAIGEFLVTRIGENTPGFAYAYPVLDNSGESLAVLTLVQGLDSFSHLFAMVSLPAGSFLAITDYQGIRLSYYPLRESTNSIGRPISPQAWDMVRGGGEKGVATVKGSDGVLRIVAFQAVRLGTAESPYMYVWAGIPEGQVLQNANKILIKNLLLMLFSTMVAFALSWLGSKKTIIAPINNLVTTARNFARGDLHLRSEVAASPGELGVLAQAFNAMAASLEQSQEKLRRSEAKYRDLFEHNADGLLVADVETRKFRHANPMICKMLGYSGEELLELGVEDLHPAADLPHILATFEKMARQEVVCSEDIPCRRKDGSIFLADINAALLDFDGAPCFIGMFRDVSERKHYERRLAHLSTHDDLTGLANRVLLHDRLAQSLHYAHRSGRLVAVLLVDLDRFKVINDSLGHDFGDQLLCAVAQRLLENVREADTVARMGGDEFVVLLAEVADAEDVGLLARKILDNLSRPYHVGHREIIITASLGISLYPKDSDSGAMLIRNADIAMYRSKRNDRSNFCFYAAEMNKHIRETLELEGELRHALERKEFCLHYQPKVDLLSGRIIGSEALIRWRHPRRGMVFPADFIPLAEETGLIVPLGAWVMREACQQARAWQAMGLPALSVAVNLSARQFRRGDLPQVVREVLQETGLDPCLLELELTESMVMGDPAGAEETMRALKNMGVRLSLDDFGTGYSSLNYLRSFPVDSLKIDRSFINDVATDPSGASVVASIIDIAHNLGLTAVAEGVETLEQLKFLSGCDCNMFQGYLFSEPLPAGEFADLLRAGRRLTVD